jgi:hypothetical protein
VDSTSKCIPLENESQKFVAINLGHQNQACQTPVGAFRVLGFFRTSEEITEKYNGQVDLDVYTVPIGAWFTITKSPTKPEDEEALQKSVVERVESYIKEREEKSKNIVELSTSENSQTRYDESKESLDTMQKVDALFEKSTSNQTVPAIPRNQELRAQNYAVVSLISSSDPNDEPIVQFFQGFDSKDDARDYMRNTLHQAKIKTNAFVVQMYEWCVPIYTQSYKFKETVESSFTHTELEELFKGQKWEQQKIKELTQSKEAQDRLKEIEKEMEAERQKNEQQIEDNEEKVSA